MEGWSGVGGKGQENASGVESMRRIGQTERFGFWGEESVRVEL
jgi:hypothetical protein